MNTRSILPLLCGALACAAITLHDAPQAHASNKYGVALTKVEASLKSGQLTVAYAMKKTTSMSLKGAKIKPSLELYESETGRFMYSFPLEAKAGSLTFPKKVSFARGGTYDLKFTGAHKGAFIHHVNWQGKKLSHLRFVRKGNEVKFIEPGPLKPKASKLKLTFDKTELKLKSGQLTVNYKVAGKSWKDLVKAKISPTIVLRDVKTGRFMHSFPMKSQAGSLTFPKSESFARGGTYSLTLVGAHKRTNLRQELRFARKGNMAVLTGVVRGKKGY